MRACAQPKILVASLLSFTRLGAAKMKWMQQYIIVHDVFLATRNVWIWVAELIDQMNPSRIGAPLRKVVRSESILYYILLW